MKTIAIIGSTGSVGSTSLKVIDKYKKNFKVKYLLSNRNFKKLNKQYRLYKPDFININNSLLKKKLIVKNSKIKSIENFLKTKKKIDFVISAVSGYSALDLNFKLLKIAKNLLIANKETIICGGKIFLKYAKKNKCKILPIDSEHYCIDFFLRNFIDKNIIKEFYLVASGGPFLKGIPKKKVSIKKVLNHPNWKMGDKISVNSANMTNKIMELFEANILFNIPFDKLKIKIENKSKIHSIISFKNGLDYFISHKTSMEIPIENSLIFYENFFESKKNIITYPKIKLILSDASKKTFPIINTGYKVLKLGYRAMIIFTIINDRLVDLFLNKKIEFNKISYNLIKIFKSLEIVNYSKKDIRTLFDIKDTIKFAEKITL